LRSTFATGLRKQKERVLAKLRRPTRKADEPDETKPDDTKDLKDISDQTVEEWLGDVVPEDEQGHLEDTMGEVYAESGRHASAQIGNTDREDFFHRINTRAVAWAKDNVGELISGVDETTRDGIRTTIANDLEAGKTRDEIADDLEEHWAFDEKRALLIANTEIADANSQGGLAGAKTARDELDVQSYKEWLVADEEACEDCLDNRDDGPIPLDDDFSSGDDAPTAHPHCRCALTYVAAPDEEEE
jgi:SPP1 gp7 family putative phage head morphogenesis protein